MDTDASQHWADFDSEVSGDLLQAVCGAFAIVATADGELATSEIDRFIELLKGKQHIFGKLDFARLETTFRELTEGLIADPPAGRRRALEYVAQAKDDRFKRELVRSAALIAIHADNKVERVEETAMRVICIALGLDADEP